jgi:RsiW-degrading membrane proteinase PrsW (M82 family)
MAVLKIAAAILAPAAFWIGYFYYKDRYLPEPLANLIAAYTMGFASGFLCYQFYALLARAGITADFQAILTRSSPMQLFSYSVVFIGIIEETFKYLPFVLVVLRFKAFDERIDGIVYAAALAIGFASFENLGYLPLMKGAAFLGRAFATPLTHTVFASIWGYTVGRAFLASLCHGLFNYLTFSYTLRFLSALLILAIWAWGIRILEKQDDGIGKPSHPGR